MIDINHMEGRTIYKMETENLDEFLVAVKGQSYKSCISDIDQALRTKVKYTEDPVPETWDDIRIWVREIITDAECEDAL